MRTIYKMKCDHASNSTSDGKPWCIICNCGIVEKEMRENEGLENRFAKCSYCGSKTPSNWFLPFFEYRRDRETDSYYCGCGGWD